MTVLGQSRTKVDIWNRACIRVGITELIEDENDDNSPQAEVCRLVYDDIVRATLAEFPWPFATTQTTLAASETTREGWEYAYPLPADCVTPLALLAEDQRIALTTEDTRLPFALQANSDGDDTNGVLLLTDYESGQDFEVLEYVCLVEHVPTYPRGFVDAIAFAVGRELAWAVAKNPSLAEQMWAAYVRTVAQAKAVALNQMVSDQELEPSSIRARA